MTLLSKLGGVPGGDLSNTHLQGSQAAADGIQRLLQVRLAVLLVPLPLGPHRRRRVVDVIVNIAGRCGRGGWVIR